MLLFYIIVSNYIKKLYNDRNSKYKEKNLFKQ